MMKNESSDVSKHASYPESFLKVSSLRFENPQILRDFQCKICGSQKLICGIMSFDGFLHLIIIFPANNNMLTFFGKPTQQ